MKNAYIAGLIFFAAFLLGHQSADWALDGLRYIVAFVLAIIAGLFFEITDGAKL